MGHRWEQHLLQYLPVPGSAMSPGHTLVTRAGATSKLTWPPPLTPSVSCNTLRLPMNAGSS